MPLYVESAHTLAMNTKTNSAKPVTVRLTAKEVKRLDELAAQSGMTRHKYMSFVLDRAMKCGMVMKETIEYAETNLDVARS